MSPKPANVHDLAKLSQSQRKALLTRTETDLSAFTAKVKPIVEAEFRRIEDEHFARSAAFSKESIDRLVKAGMTLYEAPPEELNKMFAPANVSSVYDNWYQLNERAGTDGRALVKKINDMKAKI